MFKILTGKPNLTAGELIKEARRQLIIPGYLEDAVEHLEKLMHAVPAVRGQQGSSHGLADRPVEADEELARLILTIAASFIVFFAGRAPES